MTGNYRKSINYLWCFFYKSIQCIFTLMIKCNIWHTSTSQPVDGDLSGVNMACAAVTTTYGGSQLQQYIAIPKYHQYWSAPYRANNIMQHGKQHHILTTLRINAHVTPSCSVSKSMSREACRREYRQMRSYWISLKHSIRLDSKYQRWSTITSMEGKTRGSAILQWTENWQLSYSLAN